MSCCGGGQRKAVGTPCGCAAQKPTSFTPEEQKAAVRQGYGSVAQTAPEKAPASTVGLAKSFGYTDEQLASLPDGANMGLQCGNPTAMAELKPGEHVLDLGSGGGLDVFIASKRVGPTGKAVGLDMTIEMIQRARAAAVRGKYTNVEFVLGEMEKMPLPANEFDCIISNCVVNLSPDKPAVFREMMRVLKPGGRVAISDIALKKPLPECIRSNISSLLGCVGGAIQVDEYVGMMKAAGFERVELVDGQKDLNAYFRQENAGTGPCGTAGAQAPAGGCGCGCTGGGSMPANGLTAADPELWNLLKQHDVNEYGLSAKVTAYKPATA